jgi:hypothetical protein
LNWENYYDLGDLFDTSIKLRYKVEILNQPPIASIKTDEETSRPELMAISFKGTGIDYDGVIDSYYWDFGEGSTSNKQNPIHTFLNMGTYTVTLTVTDNDGAIGKDTVIITLNTI